MNQYIGNIIVELERNLTFDSLKESYDNLIKCELDDRGKKLLAEICYLMANEYRTKQDISNANFYAKKSFELYKQLKISSLESSVPILEKYLPETMHEGVVEKRLLSKL